MSTPAPYTTGRRVPGASASRIHLFLLPMALSPAVELEPLALKLPALWACKPAKSSAYASTWAKCLQRSKSKFRCADISVLVLTFGLLDNFHIHLTEVVWLQ